MFPFAAPAIIKSAVAAVKPQEVVAILAQPANQMQAALNALPFAPDLIIDKDRVADADWAWRNKIRGLGNAWASNTFGPEASFPGYSGSNSRLAIAIKSSPKFYSATSYVGNSTAGRGILHGLSVVPGLLIIHSPSDGYPRIVWSNGIGASDYLSLYQSNGKSTSTAIFPAAPDASMFYVGANAGVNQSGVTYVVEAFAHDPSAEGIVRCGNFTTDSNKAASINLGWRPQLIIFKNSSQDGYWFLVDTTRGFGSGSDPYLGLNDSGVESNYDLGAMTAAGADFTLGFAPASTYIYLAIRAPY